MKREHETEELLNQYLDGRIDQAGLDRLNGVLREDAGARKQLRLLGMVESRLHEVGVSVLASEQFGGTSDASATKIRAVSRTVTKAVMKMALVALVGIAVGVFSTSVVWAYVTPRKLAQVGQIIQEILAFKEGFEDAGFHRADGFPVKPAEWSGDSATQVFGVEGISPKSGHGMLELGQIDDLFNRQYYVLDLQKLNGLPEGLKPGQVAEFHVSAWFCTSDALVKDRYLLRAAAVSDDLSKINPNWMVKGWQTMSERAQATAARAQFFTADQGEWQQMSLTIQVPPESRYLILGFWAGRFGGGREQYIHYIDDVRVSYKVRDSAQ
ncbi:hypothetical protein [Calycomorphotria hydatis]|uniref:Uncharacterized protein n=1 Tax=Calycomorphotria hydatis TaxID=2528027 RepID=A0A517TEC2_9PLAN|nr:hypothetical protein [Calycomorphotria hydatis]QDT66716.1 hypothetical protein V22_39870 [Calycomorphotria hydatis]